jgi:hypothetical protein
LKLRQCGRRGFAAIETPLVAHLLTRESADLGGASMIIANLTGANLTGANLTGVNLTGVNLQRGPSQKMVGHGSIQLTFDTNGHLMPDSLDGLTNALDEIDTEPEHDDGHAINQ